MLIFDQLRKNDMPLRVLTWGVLAGLSILFVGLWSVQVLSYRHFSENQRAQSFRTVRIPGIRGKILDRNGVALAENRPSYNLTLYIDEMRELFREEWRRSRPKRKLTRTERLALEAQARYRVVSNAVQKLGIIVQQPLFLESEKFQQKFLQHYTDQLALPMRVLVDLTPEQVARFQEQGNTVPGVDLEIQPLRNYPYKSAAAHIIGYLTKDNSSAEGEDAFFNFRLPDYRGRTGIEGVFDQQLRGRAGMKSVLVNSLGYRQSETVWTPVEAGKNVVLTLDVNIQRAAEKALHNATVPDPPVRGAVVVMDPQTGSILASASTPTFDPNMWVPQITHANYAPLTNEFYRPQINRATQENYAPGSIFKIIVGLACLDAGLDPLKEINVPKVIYVGKRPIRDPQADGGDYNFRRAFMKSSNSYFITNALIYGPEVILKLCEQFRLGEKTELDGGHEVKGYYPTVQKYRRGWSDGETANIAIGQGALDVTPLQMAVMTAAVANGGKVLRPRLVERIEPQETLSGEPPVFMRSGGIRSIIQVNQKSLEVVREGMLADVEDKEGTGKAAFVPGMRVCGKTGTAQKGESKQTGFELITWFASYAPYENPRYVVVVMIEGGRSGGGACAPVAGAIYKAIQELETSGKAVKPPIVADVK